MAWALTVVASFAWADEDDSVRELKNENAQLRRRVEILEVELQQLRDAVGQLAARQNSAPPAGRAQSAKPEVDGLAERAGLTLSAEHPTVSVPAAELYGFIKLDAAYDTSRASTGNFVRWVESEESNKNDDLFNMTANETRLGLRLSGADFGRATTKGLVEVDFYGSAPAENKAELMMRHAYLELDWPEKRLSLLAGQTWDVIAPLNPRTLNYPVMWWAGNIGYRRPQIRLTKMFTPIRPVDLKLEAALARTIGHDSAFDPGDSGEDAGVPSVQARASLSSPTFGTIGLSGHWAKEELDTDASGSHEDFRSWSTCLDLTQPLTRWLTLKGEAFVGENLDAYLGGIGQGVNAAAKKEIKSCGGWLAAALSPAKVWDLNLGASLENVADGDLSEPDARTYNRAFFLNIIRALGESASFGLELSHWRTEYKGQEDGDNFRAQSSLIYRF